MIETYIKEVEIKGIKEPRLYTKIENLHEWEKNYDLRVTGPDGYRRIKAQLTDLQQYKALLVIEDGTVVAGNTRLRAMKELGFTEVWISLLPIRDKHDLFKYNVSDNDNVSIYREEGVANILSDFDLNLDDYAVDFDEPIVLADIVPDENAAVIEKQPSLVTCPNCQQQFELPKMKKKRGETA